MVDAKIIKEYAMSYIDEKLSGDDTFAPNWKKKMGINVFKHASRVCDIALMLANECDLNIYEKQQLAIGCLLHDIGKAWVSKDILDKIDPLTDDDRSIINNHAMLGYTHLKTKNFSKEVLDIVYHHHERLDGTGYPEKLSEKDGISIYVQIAAVADVYEALTANRVYRKSMLTRTAFGIMKTDDMDRENYNKTGLNQLFVSILEDILLPDSRELYVVDNLDNGDANSIAI